MFKYYNKYFYSTTHSVEKSHVTQRKLWSGSGKTVGGITEGGLSGWHSPLLPPLSVQTQTAPEEKGGGGVNSIREWLTAAASTFFSTPPDQAEDVCDHRLEVKVSLTSRGHCLHPVVNVVSLCSHSGLTDVCPLDLGFLYSSSTPGCKRSVEGRAPPWRQTPPAATLQLQLIPSLMLSLPAPPRPPPTHILLFYFLLCNFTPLGGAQFLTVRKRAEKLKAAKTTKATTDTSCQWSELWPNTESDTGGGYLKYQLIGYWFACLNRGGGSKRGMWKKNPVNSSDIWHRIKNFINKSNN